MADPYYPQDGANDISGSLDDGRDERANYGKEMKRNAPLPLSVLPRSRSSGTIILYILFSIVLKSLKAKLFGFPIFK